MPLVKANPRGLQNGSTVTEFTDTTNTSAVTYTYPSQQSSLIIENSGERVIYVTVGSVTDQPVQVDTKYRYDGSFTTFSIRSDVNSQEFIATAIYKAVQDLAEVNDQLTSLTTSLADKATKEDVANALDGSPKGTYATLSALQSAFPTGTTGVYITQDNGHIYSWSGSAWGDRGQYQSAGIAPNSVGLNELSQVVKQVFYYLTNYLTNGNFNDTSNWSPAGYGTLGTLNNELTLTLSSLSANSRIEQAFTPVVGNKYYVRGDLYAKYNTKAYIDLGGSKTDNVNVRGVPNSWTTVKGIVTPTTNTAFRFYHETSSNYVANDTIKFRRIMVIDLTAIFGAGNEPTQSDIDAVIDSMVNKYFDGTQIVSNLKTLTNIQNTMKPSLDTVVSQVNTTVITGTNLVKNGNFADLSNWIPMYGTVAVLNSELTYTVSTLNSNARIEQSFTPVIGKKYYVRGDIFAKYANRAYFSVGAAQTDYEFRGVPNAWETVSGVVQPTNTDPLRFWHTTSSAYAIGDTLKFRNILMINLTDTFGAGNEPTKEDMDTYLSKFANNWFDGTASLISVKDLNNQIKELKNNVFNDIYTMAMFENLGVVGDSYASGAFGENPGDSAAIDHYNVSWPQMLGRKNGIAVTNYTKGGLSTRSWLTDAKGLSALKADTPKQLYILALIRNDYNIENNGETGYMGTEADMVSKPDTFYGNYAKIIEEIKAHAPNAKLVLMTGDYIASNVLGTAYNEAVKKIATYFGLPCMVQLDNVYFSSTNYRNNWPNGGHPGISQYNGMVTAIESMFSSAIESNVEYFKYFK